MASATPTIPVNGDKDFKAALKELAYRRRTSMAKLVRAALEKQYGTDLQDCIFFVQGVASEQHMSTESIQVHNAPT